MSEFNSLRKPFLEQLTKLAEQDDKVLLIIGDVGWRYIENFKERFPNQFLNAGAAEQNMMNMAVGFAREGYKPYVYTMANFVVFRPYEQVRNNIAWGNANVKLFAVKGSEAYAFLGMSHNVYNDEDFKLLKDLPNMNVYKPLEEQDVVKWMMEEYERNGPAYTRI